MPPNGYLDRDPGYVSLYPFDSSKDYYSSPLKAFTDPCDGKEYILEYKDDEDRLANIKKINTAITTYNKVAAKNHKEFISKLPTDGKVYSPDDFGFKKPTIPFNEHPIWGFSVMGRTGKNSGYKMVTIDNRKLYLMRFELDNDSEFITHLNCQIFKYIQTKRKESEKMGTWDSDNIWYKPNQRFHKWFQINNISVENNVPKGGRPKGITKRTVDRYKKVFHQFEILKKKYSSKTKAELYELLATMDYDGKTYSRQTIRNIIEDKKYNLIPSR